MSSRMESTQPVKSDAVKIEPVTSEPFASQGRRLDHPNLDAYDEPS